MKGVARWFFTLAIIYAVVGMLLGLEMAISQDHGHRVTHAHIMLAGWVSLALFSYFYHLFPAAADLVLARAQFWLTAISSVVMLISLYLLYGGRDAAEGGAAIGSIGYLLGVLLFGWIALREIWSDR